MKNVESANTDDDKRTRKVCPFYFGTLDIAVACRGAEPRSRQFALGIAANRPPLQFLLHVHKVFTNALLFLSFSRFVTYGLSTTDGERQYASGRSCKYHIGHGNYGRLCQLVFTRRGRFRKVPQRWKSTGTLLIGIPLLHQDVGREKAAKNEGCRYSQN